MNLKALSKTLFPNFPRKRSGIKSFAFDKTLDVKTDIQNKYGFEGDLLDLFANNRGPLVHKWHHYIPIYDQYFSKFRMKEIRFLEIGVSKGAAFRCGGNILVKTQSFMALILIQIALNSTGSPVK